MKKIQVTQTQGSQTESQEQPIEETVMEDKEQAPRHRMKPIVINRRSDVLKPIVIDRRRKQGKRRYSRGTRDLQIIERRLVISARRLGSAIEKGIDAYLTERDRSADRWRDGAIVEFIPNVGEGISIALRELSPVVADLSRAFYTRRTRRVVRRRVRSAGRLLNSLIPL